MMKNFLFLFFLVAVSLQPGAGMAQQFAELGFNGGVIRFCPDERPSGGGRSSSLDNSWGWAAGIFVENHWKQRFHQLVELNYYNLSSGMYLEFNPVYNDAGPSGQPPAEADLGTVSFDFLAFSGGIKYFFIPRLFVCPALEVARSLNSELDKGRTNFHLKVGAGYNFRAVDVMLEYSYGLKTQHLPYEAEVGLESTHRNRYLQLKVQAPLYKIGKRPGEWENNRYTVEAFPW